MTPNCRLAMILVITRAIIYNAEQQELGMEQKAGHDIITVLSMLEHDVLRPTDGPLRQPGVNN